MSERALFDAFPAMRGRVPFVPLADLPTPVHSLRPAGLDGWVKRDDLTSPVYGGNKVRTLEMLFGEARRRGAQRIYSTGAYGSNHAVATVLHAPRAGLTPGVILFPQPPSECAAENLEVSMTCGERAHALAHWSTLPFGMASVARRDRRARREAFIMVPGGATPTGGLAYVSAALELAHQVAAGELAPPRKIIVGVGSTCTSAGMLIGLHHAARLGIGFREPPELVSVRVTPWPVTARFRIVGLAVRIGALLAELSADEALRVEASALAARLTVDGRFLGKGYGRPTEAGRRAIARFRAVQGLELDTTYSAKAAAAVERYSRRGSGPVLFWSTKSTAPLPRVEHDAIAEGPARMRRYLSRLAR